MANDSARDTEHSSGLMKRGNLALLVIDGEKLRARPMTVCIDCAADADNQTYALASGTMSVFADKVATR